LTNKSKE